MKEDKDEEDRKIHFTEDKIQMEKKRIKIKYYNELKSAHPHPRPRGKVWAITSPEKTYILW